MLSTFLITIAPENEPPQPRCWSFAAARLEKPNFYQQSCCFWGKSSFRLMSHHHFELIFAELWYKFCSFVWNLSKKHCRFYVLAR